MALPVINEICRRVIPLGGKVVVDGENFAEGITEVFIQNSDCYNFEPLGPDVFGEGGCWSMWPGESIGLADRVVRDTRLMFTLPDDARFLTYDDVRITARERIHNYSYLTVALDVPGEGYSNQFPAGMGLKTVPGSAFSDPHDVHTRPLAELEDLLLNMINEIRGWNAVAPVDMHAELRDVARNHAQLMNDLWGYEAWVGRTCTGWTDCSLDPHRAPGGSDPGDRVGATGLDYVGEILDFRWGNSSTPIKNAAEFWDNSCGHRDVMLDPAAGHVGIGISRSQKTDREGHTHYYYTYTCDFAR